MPWVVESPCGARERLKLFVLDCIPLSCHEPIVAGLQQSVDALADQRRKSDKPEAIL
jgi:hypothetical protein